MIPPNFADGMRIGGRDSMVGNAGGGSLQNYQGSYSLTSTRRWANGGKRPSTFSICFTAGHPRCWGFSQAAVGTIGTEADICSLLAPIRANIQISTSRNTL